MFKNYKSKPIIRSAYLITDKDIIKHFNDKSEVLVCTEAGNIRANASIPPVAGDYIVKLSEADVYHCPREVFKERNVLTALKEEA